jgi:hypothetical protein
VQYDQRKARWTKLKMPKMARGVPKPKMADSRAGDEDDEDNDDEDSHEGSHVVISHCSNLAVTLDVMLSQVIGHN